MSSVIKATLIEIDTGRIVATAAIRTEYDLGEVEAVGISYQMHGLVVVDSSRKVLRPSIIWCDSRAVELGSRAFQELGFRAGIGAGIYTSENAFAGLEMTEAIDPASDEAGAYGDAYRRWRGVLETLLA